MVKTRGGAPLEDRVRFPAPAPPHRATTLDELLAKVQVARKRVGISKTPAWYRGVTRINHDLLPRLLRHKNGLRHERNMMSYFMTEAAGLIPSNCNSSWDKLFVMQHHGVPTRLLDWTTSLAAALYFAVRDPSGDAAMWVLNPFRLNERNGRGRIIFDESDKIWYEYYQTVRDDGNVPHEKPICVSPSWTNLRMSSQEARFTVHGHSGRALEAQVGRDVVKRVVVPRGLISTVREYVDFGASEFRFFPDLDGLARSLRHRFGLRGV